MKSFLNVFILCGLVFLVACSGGSPKPPVIPPNGSGDVWQITSLEVSNDNPLVGTQVVVTATVTKDGTPAPNGTKIEFIANGGEFSNGQTLATVLSTGGQASITFSATEAGPYSVQARVNTVTSQVQIVYRNPDTSGNLQIWSINPAEGSYAGGETVVLTGKGIVNPVEVFFTVQGTQYQAIVDQVVPSVPPESAGTITIRSPLPTAADTTITSAADVKVVVKVGTPDEDPQTYPSAFTFISDSVTIGVPVIFGVEPFYGRSQGGETVVILGLNFEVDVVTKELVQNFDEVYFTFNGQELLTQVERYSANQIEVITPRFSLTPLTTDQNAGIKLTRVGGNSIEKNDIFIVQSDVAVPEITGISPTAGPWDGGTLVTITGHGFELPVQVHFGTLEATDVQVFDDQSLGDNDVITCRTPDYSQSGQTPPLSVSIRVTNLSTGNNATASQTFTFGDVLYVGQANPTEGQIGDHLALYGAGFEDPLTVWFRGGGDTEFDVISVTGTELTLRSPPDLAPTCTDRSGDFRVVLNESNREAVGGNYTILGSDPTITSVDPIFVNETSNGNGVDPSDIDIFGVRFADDLLVLVNNYTITPNRVTVVSSEHIEVSGIPAPNDFNLVFDTTDCTTSNGLQGIKQIPTPVNVTVRNLPLGCEDTLNSTLVYVPQDQSCLVAPDLQVLIPNFPNTAAGTCSLPQQLVINNNGAGTLDIYTLILQGRFFFQNGVNQQAGPITIPPYSSNSTLDLYFCPDEATGSVFNGQLVVNSNNSGSPNNYGLSGTEETPPEIGTNPANGATWTFPDQTAGGCSPAEVLTISNIGVSPLTVINVASSDNVQFHVINPPINLVMQPLETYDLQVEFCPGAAAAQSAILDINHNGVNQPIPIQVNLEGTGL